MRLSGLTEGFETVLPVPTQFGNEERSTILPTLTQEEVQYRPPTYDFSAQLPLPNEIGVRSDDTLDSVMDAVRAMAYYTDMIGFGGSSSSLTSGFGSKLRPTGINYFMPTYQKCPNGEKMWTYVKGIPEGNAFGSLVKSALAGAGLPGLRGMAPGALEDAEEALNPVPMVQTVLGKPYPDCELKTLPVGDMNGQIADPREQDKPWITGKVEYKDGKPTQTHWIQKRDQNGKLMYLDYDTWKARQPVPPPVTEDFRGSSSTKASIAVGVVMSLFALAILTKSKLK